MTSVATTLTLTGTICYPHRQLIDLARAILLDYQNIQEEAVSTAEDEDTVWDAEQTLEDIKEITYLLDRGRYYKERGGDGIDRETGHPDDEIHAERSLPIMGANHKAEYVIPAAITLRKRTRGNEPGTGADWKTEDALLDLLDFLSRNSHYGLFRAVEMSECHDHCRRPFF
jgi:hypothetical protein